jgi:hypothetical protein
VCAGHASLLDKIHLADGDRDACRRAIGMVAQREV